MASGGKKNNFERLKKILAGKKVLLFPDMDAISEWKKLPFPMCDLKPFAGKPEKYDLADLLTEKKTNKT